jgi:hypothetical protein
VNVNQKQLQMQQSYGTHNQGTYLYSGRIEKEFFTRGMMQVSRQCNALAWNNQDPNLFAAGYETVRCRLIIIDF